MNSGAESISTAFDKAERIVKAWKALRKRCALETALASYYRGDEFLRSAPLPLGEVSPTIRGAVYQGCEVSLAADGAVLDLVITQD